MRIEVNGMNLNVEVSGKSAGGGVPLVLLHGFTGSCRSWDPFLPGWNGLAQTIAIDIIGHGKSDAPDDPARYSMEKAVLDITGVLDHLGINQAAVLGYSMGGRLALSLAAIAPERVCALLLESSSPGLRTKEERAARAAQDERLAQRIEREGIEWFVQHWENIPLFSSVKELSAEIQMKIRQGRLSNRIAGLAHSLRGMGTGVQPSWWEQLNKLHMPVLIMAGSKDEKFSTIASKMQSAGIPDCKVVSVSGAGHMIHVEQDEIFGTIVKEYLNERVIS